MIFPLIQDFADTLDAMPSEHPRQRILTLLDEAIRRDVHFIARHPTTLFQCLWNSCWWYDSPEAEGRYHAAPDERGEKQTPRQHAQDRLHEWMQQWRQDRERAAAAVWVRALCPPSVPLGGAL